MKAEIYTGENCRYCTMAKELLQEKGIEYTEKDFLDDSIEVAQRIGRIPNTVPQIFLDGEYVGGYTDLAARFGVDTQGDKI